MRLAFGLSAALGLALAFGSVGFAGPFRGPSSAPETSGPTTVKTYPVADLVYVAPNQKPSLGEFAGLLAKSTGPERWAAPVGEPTTNRPESSRRSGGSSIVPFNLSLSLIVRGTEDDHKAIQNRLSLLREHKALVSGGVLEAVEKRTP